MTINYKLLRELVEINVFKIGEFQLKTGGMSPIYVDLRGILGYPKILRLIAEAIKDKTAELNMTFDNVCGVPYCSVPTAAAISVMFDAPIILKRKEAKSYGTKKLVEGVINAGDKCLVIEDVVVSGSSIIETARSLRDVGLIVTDCISVLDRKQGGQENLDKEDISYHPLFSVHDMFEMYCEVNKISEEQIALVNDYLSKNNYVPVNRDQCPELASKASVINHDSPESIDKTAIVAVNNGF